MTANVPKTMQSVLVFDGKKDQVVLTHPLEEITDAITIEFWANEASKIGSTTTIIYGVGANNRRIVNIHLPWAKYIYWDTGDDKTYDRISKGVKSAEYKNSWNHWAFIKDAKKEVMCIYRNGEIFHSVPRKKRSLASIETFFIGSKDNSTLYWTGALAELRVWNIALEQSQLQANMHQRLTGKESGLLVYLPLNEGKGTVVEDKSSTGKKNNGKIAGASWQQMEIPLPVVLTETTTPQETSKSESTQVDQEVEEVKEMAKAKKTETTKAGKEAEPEYIPATGLEDYARWKTIYKDYQRDKNEKPFRRGRISS